MIEYVSPPDSRGDTFRLTRDHQDNSGTIERDEFLSLPQISSNPLATRHVLPQVHDAVTQANTF